jgi:hypothetical protein
MAVCRLVRAYLSPGIGAHSASIGKAPDPPPEQDADHEHRRPEHDVGVAAFGPDAPQRPTDRVARPEEEQG